MKVGPDVGWSSQGRMIWYPTHEHPTQTRRDRVTENGSHNNRISFTSRDLVSVLAAEISVRRGAKAARAGLSLG